MSEGAAEYVPGRERERGEHMEWVRPRRVYVICECLTMYALCGRVFVDLSGQESECKRDSEWNS